MTGVNRYSGMTAGLVQRLCKALAGALIALMGGAAWSCPAGTEVARDQVWLFPSASEPLREGLVRVVNRSGWSGEVRIVPIDDAGQVFDALPLTLDAHETVHIGSTDLETGNPDKGLSGGAGAGAWRLVLSSGLDIEVLSFIRTRDGMLSAMHDIVPGRDDGCRVAILDFGTGLQLTGVLRLINLGAEQATFTIRGIEEGNGQAQGDVRLAIDAYAARSLTARELASGAPGLEGMLGDGPDLRELVLESDGPFAAMSLVRSASGHLTNLSSVPLAPADGVHRVPLLVPAGAPGAAQGVLRILNGTDETGSVEIYAIDDAGMRSGPASFTLNGSSAVEFTAADLASGNAMLGLSGGIGTDVGDARLELVTDLQIVPLAYVRAADGTLSAMHDTVRAAAVDGAEGHRYEVPLFNPASDVVHESWLRLINPGNAAASVTIGGRGDRGAVAAGATVQMTLAAGTARTSAGGGSPCRRIGRSR